MAIRFTVENPWGDNPQEKFEFIFLRNGDLTSTEGEVIPSPPISTPMDVVGVLAAWYPRATEIYWWWPGG